MNPEVPETPKGSLRPFDPKKRKRTWNEKIRRVNFYDEKLSLENFLKATSANDIAMVEAYLQHGQDPNEHSGNFQTPLHIAAMSGFETLVHILVNHPEINVNPLDRLGRTPLSRACRYSYFPIVELLLENGADCDLADRTGYTPLHHTALWGWHDITDLLLSYNAEPNRANAFGKTPLHIACIDTPNMLMVRMLCENGADINMESALVMPVLLMSCLNCFDNDDLNMIDLLIHFDADVNVIYSPGGQTALHCAAINGFVPLAEVLCTAGANPNVMDRQFRTPYDVAVQMENQEMVQFLRVFFEDDLDSLPPLERTATAIVQQNKETKRKRNYESF